MQEQRKTASGERPSLDPSKVLVCDDDPETRQVLGLALERRGFRVTTVPTADDALARLAQSPFDVVVADVHLGGTDGLALCQAVASSYPGLPVLMVTGDRDLSTAVAALRAGASDFLSKPVETDALVLALERARQQKLLHEEVRHLRRAVEAKQGYGALIGQSPRMHAVFELVDRVGASDATVLITGESGTGKELVARLLHERSHPGGPFVVVNCAAIPEPLLESELFGHVRGAYTDAKSARTGLFVRAHGGTLFLDEIGELPVSMQPKLLRALQERRVKPVGEDTEVRFEARIVAATNRDLESAVEEHRFREDLYFRINVIHLELPPLRERGGDVLLLAERFIEDCAQRQGRPSRPLSPDAARILMAYDWPGNVRELMNCIEHAVALANGAQIEAADLPRRIQAWKPSQVLIATDSPDTLVSLDEVERRYILRVLETVGGNKARAARILHLDRTTLYRRLERYGVE